MAKKEKEFAVALCGLMKEFEREMELVKEGKLVLTSFDGNSTVQEIIESIGLNKKDLEIDESALASFIKDDTERNKNSGKKGDKTFENWLKENKTL